MSERVSTSERAQEELLAGIIAWREGRRDEAFDHLQACGRWRNYQRHLAPLRNALDRN
ncbi:MAG TPA: hypothetical protein VN541_04055 [Tepidisphaeraceae bacterium]|nr:hypothetical protein [Tepidisphaeraceae bacterium]